MPLLADPGGLEIEESPVENGKLLSVWLSKPDMGRVIGRGGQTIKAVRTLIHTAGMKINQKAIVEVNEPKI